MSKRNAETSKFLSYVLRHEPLAIGLVLDREGWAYITALIAGGRQSGRELDEALIHAVVESSDKKRFAISEDELRIRAVLRFPRFFVCQRVVFMLPVFPDAAL